MDKQFTANEVRRLSNRIPRSNDEIADAQDALRAYADRLEADEKAEAVELDYYDAGHLNDFGGGNVSWWWDYIRNELGRAHSFYQSQVDSIMSAPPDAERLAEALRQIAVTTKGYPNASREGEIAIKALAAHSAKAQPPYELDPAITEKWENGELGRSLEYAQVAQPPAARVTDAVFPSHRACVPYENHPGKRIVGFVIDESHPWWGKCGLTEPLSALEAMLAAQENPNG